MRKVIVVIIGLVVIGCKSKQAAQEDLKLSRFEIDFMLNSWHQAADLAVLRL
mgnify:CR=1 FL=1